MICRLLFTILILSFPLFGEGEPSDGFLPDSHEMKKNLDYLFRSSSSTSSHRRLKSAGFTLLRKESANQVVVATHPQLKGYLLKLHLDSQIGCSDRSMCLSRTQGAWLLRQEIEKRGFQHLFKVPKKWVYPLPNRTEKQKRWILLVEDMRTVPDEVNLKCWKSGKFMTKELLLALFNLTETVGMRDFVYVDNMPFSLDKKIAFIDTEHFGVWPVPYKRLTGRLPEELQPFWKKITRKARQK